VVDDDPEIVELMQDVLGRDERFDVECASTGYDAGMLTQQLRPHLVLLDYMLPDINGNLVCKRIRNTPELAETKIIIVSGVVNQEEIEDLKQMGADAFIKKPFNLEQLRHTIEETLGL
jgi:DNA-binding response OmpR family regulator